MRPAKACSILAEGERDTAQKALDVPEGFLTVARLQTLPIWVVRAYPQVTSVLQFEGLYPENNLLENISKLYEEVDCLPVDGHPIRFLLRLPWINLIMYLPPCHGSHAQDGQAIVIRLLLMEVDIHPGYTAPS